MTVENTARYQIATDGEPDEWQERPTFVSAGDGGTSHLCELEAFVDAVETGERPLSNAVERYRRVVHYEAIERTVDSPGAVDVTYDL